MWCGSETVPLLPGARCSGPCSGSEQAAILPRGHLATFRDIPGFPNNGLWVGALSSSGQRLGVLLELSALQGTQNGPVPVSVVLADFGPGDFWVASSP